ncbi:Glycosyltransferase 61 catalytic domain-containing protein [Plasmodiophora brassicae]|uniref:Glycosyltransferase 61 catalytic domain-containing protein n=1 Tax=Plasmodiophora brassicae TaxID=37360 RepID=A0A0G4J311_PLABS|nr:hypothetical protein PBRA_008558 [Plasmodiophora brassicae]SPQ99457.1 unnamed protein product [Plasmodiophora brassicae]
MVPRSSITWGLVVVLAISIASLVMQSRVITRLVRDPPPLTRPVVAPSEAPAIQAMHAGDCAGDAYCLESAPQWFEFRRVAFHRGHIVFFGQANSTIVRDIEPQAYKYRAFLNGGIVDLQQRFHADARPWDPPSFCDEHVRGTSFLSSVWVANNAFHAHNDNLLPLFWQADRLGVVPLLPNCTLFEIPSDRPELAVLHDTKARMFGTIRGMPRDQRTVCLDHLVWGYGPQPFYRSWFEIDALAPAPYWYEFAHRWQRYVRQLYRPKRPADRSNRVVFFHRTGGGGRAMAQADFEAFVGDLQARHLDVTVISGGDQFDDIVGLLEIMQDASCVLGTHGAGLVNALYARDGAALVELRTDYAFETRLFENVALDAGLSYVSVDFRMYTADKPGGFPSERRRRLADVIVSAMANQIDVDRDGGSHRNPIVL